MNCGLVRLSPPMLPVSSLRDLLQWFDAMRRLAGHSIPEAPPFAVTAAQYACNAPARSGPIGSGPAMRGSSTVICASYRACTPEALDGACLVGDATDLAGALDVFLSEAASQQRPAESTPRQAVLCRYENRT